MKNFEKYKSTKERCDAFLKWCRNNRACGECCPLYKIDDTEYPGVCGIYWLDLEAEEEKLLPCPFCGNKCRVFDGTVICKSPDCYTSKTYNTDEEAIAAHNRVAKAVMESEVS